LPVELRKSGISPVTWYVQMCREVVLGLLIGGNDPVALPF